MRAFVSYPSERVDQARTIRNFLASVECPYWWDKENLIGGQDWDRARKEAQAHADLILILCASETRGRDGVYQREINEALRAIGDRRPDQIYIVCLRTEAVELPSELSRLHYIDMFVEGWKQKLARSLKEAFGQRGVPVPAPLEVAAAETAEQAYTRVSLRHEVPDLVLESQYIRYDLVGGYWDYINAEIAVQALGGYFQTLRWTQEIDREGSSEWATYVSEFYRRGEVVSTIMSQSYYFAGTPHPNHGITTMSFLGSQFGKVEVNDLFEDDDQGLAFLKAYTDLDIKRQFLGSDDPLDLSWIIDTAGISFFSQFTVNDAGLVFHFSAPSGLPHVYGLLDVYVPLDAISALLAARVRRLIAPGTG